MPQGEARRMTYKRGVERPRSLPVDAGQYQLNLKDYGKLGLAGWTSKQGKFPYRFASFEIADTVDEQTGGLKTVRTVISVNPRAFFNIHDLAAAVDYPEDMDLPEPTGLRDTNAIREICKWVDDLLGWIRDNNVTIQATLRSREYNGRTSNEVASFDAPNTLMDGNGPEDDPGDDEEPGDNGEGNGEEEPAEEPEKAVAAAEEEPPRRSRRKGSVPLPA